jgi:hypothetical protein
MGRNRASILPTICAVVLFSVLIAVPAPAEGPEKESAGLLPAPRPFTLNLYDARMAKAMLERVPAVQMRDGGRFPEQVPVKDVRIVYVGEDPERPGQRRYRYDLYLNGRPLDWTHTYIEYDFEMVNLRMLFTYRNQRPVPEGPYSLQ